MGQDHHTIASRFGDAGTSRAPIKEFSHDELMHILRNPSELLTHEVAVSMAQPHGSPAGYAARMTKDGTGFAVARHDRHQVSIFLKPDDSRPGAFWEIDLLARQFKNDPAVAGYLHSVPALYNAAQGCLTHLQSDGSGWLHTIEADFAKNFRTLVDGIQAQGPAISPPA